MRAWRSFACGQKKRKITPVHPFLCQHVWYLLNTEAQSADLQTVLFHYLHVLTCMFYVINPFFGGVFFFNLVLTIYLFIFVYTLLETVMWHLKNVITLVSWDCIYKLRNYESVLVLLVFTLENSVKRVFFLPLSAAVLSQLGAGRRRWHCSRDFDDQRSWPRSLGLQECLE